MNDLGASRGAKDVFNRKGFLRTILAAPVAAAVAAGLWKPPLPRLVRIQGKMAITGDAMKRMRDLERKDAFKEALGKMLEEHRRELDRFTGYHDAAWGDEQ